MPGSQRSVGSNRRPRNGELPTAMPAAFLAAAFVANRKVRSQRSESVMTRIIDPPPPSPTSGAWGFRLSATAALAVVLLRARGYMGAIALAVPLIVLGYDLVGIAAFLTAVSVTAAHRAGGLGVRR